MADSISLHQQDNLGIALKTLQEGSFFDLNGFSGKLKETIREKHKFTLYNLKAGDRLIMYGVVVGEALVDIEKGMAITTVNTANATASYNTGNLDTKAYSWKTPNIERFRQLTFKGYHRKDGQVGTENNWLVFPLVFCENRNILVMKKAFEKALGYQKNDLYEDFIRELKDKYQKGESLDTVKLKQKEDKVATGFFQNVSLKFITHSSGCGGTREDAESLCRLLAGYLKNPNVAGATVLSLGCQNAQEEILLRSIKDMGGIEDKPVLIFNQQKLGSEQVLLEQAIKATFKGLIEADKLQRKEANLSKLTIGLECGGSDGFSGISANPLLGYVSDIIVTLGGRVILSEFPELGGVEQEIINRTKSKDKAEKFVKLMKDYARAAEQAGSGFDMNPSPGNIKDGLITDAMKSAGAAKKGGSSPVNDVLDYTEYIKSKGLNLLCTPGNDVESTTALVGSGANMVLFTTGLGTPTGNPVAPVIKVSSNTSLFKKMNDIIDFNAGEIIDGLKTPGQLAEELLLEIVKIASGEQRTKSALLNQDDFIHWKRGVSL